MLDFYFSNNCLFCVKKIFMAEKVGYFRLHLSTRILEIFILMKDNNIMEQIFDADTTKTKVTRLLC